MKDIGLTVGCDPEFFLKKDGRFVSAHDLVPGTKQRPAKLYKGAVQADGVAVEFNIDPVSSFEEFNDNIDVVLEQVREIIPREYEFVFEADAQFDHDYFFSLPEYSRALGCDPDFNYYGYRRLPTDYPALRFGGGHMHFGWDKKKYSVDAPIIALNFYRAWLNNHHKDTSQRAFNNQSGYHRDKPYGIELRDPSNFWFKDRDSRRVLFDCALTSVHNTLTSGGRLRRG